MRAVTRFESNLLRILWFFLRRVPSEQAVPLLLMRQPRPPCLSRDAVELAQDALAKGCVILLAREGAWRRGRFLRQDQVVEGRLWERTPPQQMGLVFSRQTLLFLMWATAAKPGEEKEPSWSPQNSELTPADHLLLFLAYDALRGTELAPAFRALPAFAAHPLCQLAFPEDYAGGQEVPVPDFVPWTAGLGSCILEAVQPHLARRWLQVERGKAQVADWQQMQVLGQNQERVLEALFLAVENAGRRDLVRFLLAVAEGLLPAHARPEMWTGGLSSAGPRMADRGETHRAALAFLRQLERLRSWERQARTVGYFDEGYASSQLWKDDWDRCQGETLHARAQAIIQKLDPLRTQT